MLFKFLILALAAAVSVVAVEISAADMVSNIDGLSDLTRAATAATQYAVYVNNPPPNRRITVKIIGAIGTQATLDQDLMTGHACGSLTKRYSGSIASRAKLEQRQASNYTLAEQADVANAYATLVAVTEAFMAVCVEKHPAVVAHGLAHGMGQALDATSSVLDTMTDTIMPMVPTQSKLMSTQKGLLDQSYSSTVDLYVNGPA